MNLSGEALTSEADLIHRAREGDGAAWEDLMLSHQEAVFRLAYLLLGDADDAEDVAQESFIRAYRALERFDTTRPLRPWLLSISANLARNQRRSIGRYLSAVQRLFQAEQGLDPSSTGVSGSKSSIEDKSSRRWEAQTLWKAVQRLNTTDQQVIYLRYFLELSVEEVAESIAIPKGTVKSRLHRAMNRLREIIERDFPDLRETDLEEGRLQEGRMDEQ